MTKRADSTPAQSDANGWIEGLPTAEGSYWYCTDENKYDDWRVYLGNAFEYRGEVAHTLLGYGTVRTKDFKNVYYQPVTIPELPVATLKKSKTP